MTQQEVDELQVKAQNGDAAAQYEFGLLLVVNNYYDAGKNFITKSAEQKNENALVWIDAHKKLTAALETDYSTKSFSMKEPGKQIRLWNVKKGELADDFYFSSLRDGEILIFVDKTESSASIKHFHNEIISEEYFHILYDLWNAYMNEKIPAKTIKPTRNAKYIISILHFLIESNTELQAYAKNTH